MNTMKSARALRVWKAILFMMTTIMFAVCFGNTAWADTVLYENNRFNYYAPSTEYHEFQYTWGDSYDSYGNGEWGNADYDNGARSWSEQKKILYLTKDEVLRWKAGDQIIFRSSDREVWRNSDYTSEESFTVSATLYVANGSTNANDYGLDSGSVYKFTSNYPSHRGPLYPTHILTLDQTPSIPSNAAPVYHVQCGHYSGYGGSQTNLNGYYSINRINRIFSDDMSRNGFTWTHSYYKRNSGTGSYSKCYESHTIDSTPYYGKLVIKVEFRFNTDDSDGSIGGYGKIKKVYVTDSVIHSHNSNGVDYNQGNDNQHIKYTYCNGHGSDHSQNRSGGTWENHTWVHVNATTDKCSACGKTRTRYYYDPGQSGDSGIYVNVSVMSPTGVEDQKSGYFQLSRDGVNWSSETTDQIMSYVQSFKYNDKLYVRYTRPYYDYYELDSVTHKLAMTKINDNTWCYTVQSESPRQEIRLNMKYKPFDVHYILSGGSLPNKKDTYIITDTFTIGEPSLSGYTFTGWTMTCSKGKANDRSFTSCNILVPTKDVTISNMYGGITLTANYEKSGTNDDNGHNKTPDDNGSPDHITDTCDRKTPLVTDSNSKHNMFRVTK